MEGLVLFWNFLVPNHSAIIILRRHDDCRLTRPECELQWWLRLLHGSESTVIWADRNKSDINSTAQKGSVLTNVTLWSLSVHADAKIDARTTEIAQIAIRLAQCSSILAETLFLFLANLSHQLWREAERNLKGGKVLWLDVVPLKGGKSFLILNESYHTQRWLLVDSL